MLSIWHWLIVLVFGVLWVIPLARILGKAGMSKGWAILALIPPLALIIVWIIAFSDWTAKESSAPYSGEGPRFKKP